MKLSISRKIGFGFGLFILATLALLVLTNKSLTKSLGSNKEISTVLNPSLEKLQELKTEIEQSKTLIVFWAFVESTEDVKEKTDLLEILNSNIPRLRLEIDTLSKNWNQQEIEAKLAIYDEMDALFSTYREVQDYLPDFAAYAGGINWMFAREIAEDDGTIDQQYTDMMAILDELIEDHRENSENEGSKMVSNFEQLNFYLTYIGIALVIAGILIALLTTRSIVRPVRQLKGNILSLGKGVIPKQGVDFTNDEIGEMTIALDNLVDGLKRTRDFANAIGKGDFAFKYKPLSEEDETGKALVQMAEDRQRGEQILEEKVTERTVELKEKNVQIEKQNKRVTELYKDVTDSIRYAKRLQTAMLPEEGYIKSLFPKSFIFFNPKDIVSGDFYWFDHRGDYILYAAVDCTGHGVPGAFMSMVGHNALNMAVSETENLVSGELLTKYNKITIDSLNRKSDDRSMRDGMDMTLCVYNKKTKELQFSGAGRPLLYFQDGVPRIVKGDRYAVGSMEYRDHQYKTHKIQLKENDTVYVWSDGYPDQFGGDTKTGKKFKNVNFNKLLQSIQLKDMDEQFEVIWESMVRWQANHPQVDDMLIIGIKI